MIYTSVEGTRRILTFENIILCSTSTKVIDVEESVKSWSYITLMYFLTKRQLSEFISIQSDRYGTCRNYWEIIASHFNQNIFFKEKKINFNIEKL